MSMGVNNIESLKQIVAKVMPILDKNLNAAHDEYMAGDIPKGAFSYVLSRHGVAQSVASLPQLDFEDAMRALAPVTIDLEYYAKRGDDGDKALLAEWFDYFDRNGYSERNILFGFPTKPSVGA